MTQLNQQTAIESDSSLARDLSCSYSEDSLDKMKKLSEDIVTKQASQA